ncbi:MAG: hypothetical protein AB8E87_02260, partial [Prochlorococcus sp.]
PLTYSETVVWRRVFVSILLGGGALIAYLSKACSRDRRPQSKPPDSWLLKIEQGFDSPTATYY